MPTPRRYPGSGYPNHRTLPLVIVRLAINFEESVCLRDATASAASSSESSKREGDLLTGVSAWGFFFLLQASRFLIILSGMRSCVGKTHVQTCTPNLGADWHAYKQATSSRPSTRHAALGHG